MAAVLGPEGRVARPVLERQGAAFLDVGGVVPAGECPKCGALCYDMATSSGYHDGFSDGFSYAYPVFTHED